MEEQEVVFDFSSMCYYTSFLLSFFKEEDTLLTSYNGDIEIVVSRSLQVVKDVVYYYYIVI